MRNVQRSVEQRTRRWLSLVVVWAGLGGAAAAQGVRGVVLDPAGAVVQGAEVSVSSATPPLRAVAGTDGRFHFESVAPPATIVAHKDGFAPASLAWRGEPQVEIVLRPATVQRQIIVSATRNVAEMNDVAAAVTR